MRVMITGIAGFVGSHLTEFLLEETDWDIWGFLRWNTKMENLNNVIDRINAKDRIRLIFGDLRDPWSVGEAIREVKPDYVFHLAAQSYPLTSFTSPHSTLDTNILGTLNLLEGVKKYGQLAYVQVCSSSEVYGKVDKVHIPINEDCPFSPTSPYSIGKIGTDLLGQMYANAYKLNIMITRMFTHTGARRGDVFAESSFAKQIAMIEAGQQEPPILVGNLDSWRTFTDVRDTVRAYYMLLTIDPQPGEVYNIGSSYSCSMRMLLDTLLSISGRNYDVIVDNSRLRPIDADLQIPDCTKFVEHTGWAPRITFEETMESLLEYWREQVKVKKHLIR